MIVDLLRNDLGRICCYDSIQARLWDVEVLPQLLHLVSHVEGTLRAGVGLLEILRALFPCGSITGAPKIRAMEILAEIEPAPRGISMGAIGIIRGAPGSGHCKMISAWPFAPWSSRKELLGSMWAAGLSTIRIRHPNTGR